MHAFVCVFIHIYIYIYIYKYIYMCCESESHPILHHELVKATHNTKPTSPHVFSARMRQNF